MNSQTRNVRREIVSSCQDEVFAAHYQECVPDYIAFNTQMLAREDCLLCIRNELPRYTVPPLTPELIMEAVLEDMIANHPEAQH